MYILASKASKGTKNSGGGGGGGGNPGDGPDGIPPNLFYLSGAILIVATMLSSSSGDANQGREISWQEFSGQLLESGQVDRILIANKTTARYLIYIYISENQNPPRLDVQLKEN